jgi:hypothetical protein
MSLAFEGELVAREVDGRRALLATLAVTAPVGPAPMTKTSGSGSLESMAGDFLVIRVRVEFGRLVLQIARTNVIRALPRKEIRQVCFT